MWCLEDAEFLKRLQERIKEFSGQDVELELGEHGTLEVDIERPVPKVLVAGKSWSIRAVPAW